MQISNLLSIGASIFEVLPIQSTILFLDELMTTFTNLILKGKTILKNEYI